MDYSTHTHYQYYCVVKLFEIILTPKTKSWIVLSQYCIILYCMSSVLHGIELVRMYLYHWGGAHAFMLIKNTQWIWYVLICLCLELHTSFKTAFSLCTVYAYPCSIVLLKYPMNMVCTYLPVSRVAYFF